MVDILEVAEDTGISVDEVLAGLEDFASVDALLSFGVSLAAETAEEVVCAETPVRMDAEPIFTVQTPPVSVAEPGGIFKEELSVVYETAEPEPLFPVEEKTEPAPRAEAVIVETVKPERLRASAFFAAKRKSEAEVREDAVIVETAAPVVARQDEQAQPRLRASAFFAAKKKREAEPREDAVTVETAKPKAAEQEKQESPRLLASAFFSAKRTREAAPHNDAVVVEAAKQEQKRREA